MRNCPSIDFITPSPKKNQRITNYYSFKGLVHFKTLQNPILKMNPYQNNKRFKIWHKKASNEHHLRVYTRSLNFNQKIQNFWLARSAHSQSSFLQLLVIRCNKFFIIFCTSARNQGKIFNNFNNFEKLYLERGIHIQHLPSLGSLRSLAHILQALSSPPPTINVYPRIAPAQYLGYDCIRIRPLKLTSASIISYFLQIIFPRLRIK